MRPSRRDVLTAAGAGGIAGALAALFPPIASAVPALEEDEYGTLTDRWVDLLTGRDLIDPASELFDTALADLDASAEDHLAHLLPRSAQQVFSDRGLKRDADVSDAMSRLADLAVAWATPGSAFHEDSEVRDRAIDGIRNFRELIYNPSQPEFGNWWTWEIGVPKDLSNAMAIFREHLTADDVADLSSSIDYYVPDPWEQYPPERGRIASEGANRVDLCQVVIIRSIVGREPDRLAHAVAGLSDVWQIVDSGNGFYADGSFVQHGAIGYTGTYGLVLLGGLSKLFALLSGTSHDITDPTRVNLTDAVDDSFAPLVVEGQMMDAVRGRAISRETERSIDDGNKAIQSILELAKASDEETAARWRGMCRAWLDDNDRSTIFVDASISRLAVVSELLDSDVDPYRLPAGAHLFTGMDRLVYRGEGWAACIAMCSSRIAWYECGNGENDDGGLTSQGMTYLYLPEADGHFDDEFWATCDLQGLAGITVDTTPLPPQVEGEWAAATPESEWAGGSVLGDMAVAGQHMVAPGGTGLTARKSWFLLPGSVVALGSDISTGTEAEVKTVIEHRNLGTGDGRLLLDGEEVGSDPVTSTRADWAHLEGVGGYLFLGDRQVRASLAHREGAWSRNSTAGSEDVHQRLYATIDALHPESGGTYSYVVLPGADEAATRCAASDRPVSVIRNDETVQAIRAAELLAANFWGPGRVQNVTADQPMCLIRSGSGTEVEFAVSDPTQQLQQITFTHDGHAVTGVEGSERVGIRRERGTVQITIDVSDLGGAPVTFRLSR